MMKALFVSLSVQPTDFRNTSGSISFKFDDTNSCGSNVLNLDYEVNKGIDLLFPSNFV